MSFLEVIPPHVRLHGPGEEGEGGNTELGDRIYWHFFKGDSWCEDTGTVREKWLPIHLLAAASSERLAVFRLH